ncbi:MAG: T9SS type A sorting domain-containing protein [Bacteroidales bacterium]|nr:T9SS type A sorting domain-containing protein [Bacteroidales bacterium]
MIKKTLLTITLCSLFGFLSAQSLQFGYFDDDAVFHGYANNERIICNNAPTEWGEMILEKVGVKNLTNASLDVQIEKEEIELVFGTQNSFCWGQCYAPTTFVSSFPITIEGGATCEPNALSFHQQIDSTYMGTNLIPGTSVVKYHTYPLGHPEDRATIEVWFAYNAESVPETPVAFGKATPNPAGNMVRFDIQGGHGTIKAVIYNLLGQEVKRQVVDGTHGKIEFTVSDLQEGFYFCSFFVNDEMVKTDKFIVKR